MKILDKYMVLQIELNLRIDNSGWRHIKLNGDISGSQQGILTNNTPNKSQFFFLSVDIWHMTELCTLRKWEIRNRFFHFYFLNTDISLGFCPAHTNSSV